jgi:hypothetical protein
MIKQIFSGIIITLTLSACTTVNNAVVQTTPNSTELLTTQPTATNSVTTNTELPTTQPTATNSVTTNL